MPAVLLTPTCFLDIIISRKGKTREIEMEIISTLLTKKIYTAGHCRAGQARYL